jgi:hypothetical protein
LREKPEVVVSNFRDAVMAILSAATNSEAGSRESSAG